MTAASALAAVVGCAPPAAAPPLLAPRVDATEAPRVTPGPLDATPLLAGVATRAQQLGAGPVAMVTSGTMAEGERAGGFVDVPAGACLLAYARAATSLEDVDLAVFTDEGVALGIDEGPDPSPTVLVCPPLPDRVYVAVHAAAGAGLGAVGAQLVPRERADDVGRAVNARGASAKAPEVWPGLDEHVRAHRAAIGGTWSEQRRVAVPVDTRAPSRLALSVGAGACVDVVVVPDEDVAVLEVEVLDAEGRHVTRARNAGDVRTVTVCSETPIAGSLEVRPHVGRGVVAVVVATATGSGARAMLAKPEVAWASPGLPLDAARARLERTLSAAGYAAARAAHAGHLPLGRRVTVPIALPAAPCARIDVVAGAPLALVEAAAWDDAGGLLATGEGASGAALFTCGKRKARVDLGTRGRPGPFVVLVRPEAWSDAALAAHPLAASRMIARASGLGTAPYEGRAGAVRHAALDHAKRHAYEIPVAAGRCVTVSAGVAGEGTGLELRVTDAATGEELDRAHGQTSAAVRACAAEAARTVRVEARATAGKLDAIFGERTTSAE